MRRSQVDWFTVLPYELSPGQAHTFTCEIEKLELAAAGSGEVNILEIAAGDYAKASFELDDSEYGAAWNWVYSVWLPSSGYQPDDGPTLECYPGRPGEHPAPKRRVEIWVPVKPL